MRWKRRHWRYKCRRDSLLLAGFRDGGTWWNRNAMTYGSLDWFSTDCPQDGGDIRPIDRNTWALPRIWMSLEVDSPQSLQKRKQTCQHLDRNLWRAVWGLWPTDCETIDLSCYKPLHLWCFFIAGIEAKYSGEKGMCRNNYITNILMLSWVKSL